MTAAASGYRSAPDPSDELSPVRIQVQERAKVKIDAYGIGKGETRHPRWERCAAPIGATRAPYVLSGV